MPPADRDPAPDLITLTKIERHIVKLLRADAISKGPPLSDEDLADELSLSKDEPSLTEAAVKDHLRRIYTKLELPDDLTETERQVVIVLCRPPVQNSGEPEPATNTDKISDEAEPATNPQIAEVLRTQPSTVTRHLTDIYGKFQLGESKRKKNNLVTRVLASGLLKAYDRPSPPTPPPPGASIDTPPPGPTPVRIAVSALGAITLVVVLVVLLNGGERPGPPRPPRAVADPAWLDEPPSGGVRYCTGRDVSFTQRRSVKDFNDFIRSDKRGTARARIVQLSPKANEQRDQYRERIANRSCDVVFLDVPYGPEFAADNLLYDLSDYIKEREEGGARFQQDMLDTVEYDGRLWGVPKQLDGGVLYYRRDQVQPQSTWRRLLRATAGRKLLRLQLDAYEGATVTFLELAYAAGADDIVADGEARLVQEGTRAALEFLLEAIRLKALPKSVPDQEEKGSLYVYEVGNAKYLRSWPYAALRIPRDARDPSNEQDAAKRRTVVKHTRVAPLPLWDSDSPRVGILGGHNLVIPRSAPNPHAALHLVRFLTTRDQMLRDARGGSLMPAREDLWSHPTVRSRPALEVVTQLDLRVRPILPCYYELSEVIYTRVNEALTTPTDDVDGVLEDMQVAVQAVLDDGC